MPATIHGADTELSAAPRSLLLVTMEVWMFSYALVTGHTGREQVAWHGPHRGPSGAAAHRSAAQSSMRTGC
jgi:hypothetical protein